MSSVKLGQALTPLKTGVSYWTVKQAWQAFTRPPGFPHSWAYPNCKVRPSIYRMQRPVSICIGEQAKANVGSDSWALRNSSELLPRLARMPRPRALGKLTPDSSIDLGRSSISHSLEGVGIAWSVFDGDIVLRLTLEESDACSDYELWLIVGHCDCPWVGKKAQVQ
jgi:hypothetical protein